MLEEEEEDTNNDVTGDEGILLDVADSEEGTDSNKIEDESMETSFPVKSEVFDNENDEKHDAEKDIDIAELLHTEGDIKLEDLEEENDMNQSTPEVWLSSNSLNLCLFIIVVNDPEIEAKKIIESRKKTIELRRRHSSNDTFLCWSLI